jgi:hypothetical protein
VNCFKWAVVGTALAIIYNLGVHFLIHPAQLVGLEQIVAVMLCRVEQLLIFPSFACAAVFRFHSYSHLTDWMWLRLLMLSIPFYFIGIYVLLKRFSKRVSWSCMSGIRLSRNWYDDFADACLV